MKILLLNHHINAQHKITARLQAAGAVVLSPNGVEEAWKMIQLHGTSLDLAIIHLEGQSDQAHEEGNELIAQIKGDPSQADLPIILTSSSWSEADFFQHQQSSLGVNAYLRWPFSDDELINTIETMFGNSIRFAGATLTGTQALTGAAPSLTTDTAPIDSSLFSGMDIQLEEPGDPSLSISSDLKLDVPQLTPVESGGIELASDGVVPEFKFEPSSTTANSALSLDSVAHTGPVLDAPSLTPPESLDISAEMNAELEPHERLEFERQKKAMGQGSGGIQISLQSDDASLEVAGPAVEPGTMVLDSGSVSADAGAGAFDIQQLEPLVSAPEAPAQVAPVQQRVSADDEEIAAELPYLFSKKKTEDTSAQSNSSALVFAEPVGDAVIPGGAIQSPDTETLKKYLMLREQDVAILSNQLKAARDQIGALEKKVKEENAKNSELEHVLSGHQKRIEEFEREKSLALQGLQSEIEELRFQNKTKSDKARLLEAKVNEATQEIERLKERVRNDIRKIRVREKELENKLEIMRKDSEALITARETKIMELKRKIDLLEFNMDLLQDQNAREKENSAQLRERLAKAAQVVRVAGGLLDTPGKNLAEEILGDGSETRGSREAS